jgi:hypothetical protein
MDRQVHRTDRSFLPVATRHLSWPEAYPAESWSGDGLPEELIRYGLATRPVFHAFRSVASQLGGALILYAVAARERTELATLGSANQRFEEGVAALEAIHVPACMYRHAVLLKAVATELRAALADLSDLFHRPLDRGAITALMRRLQAARAGLLEASDPRLGMMIVDFSQGCCGCGHSPSHPLKAGGNEVE